MSQTNESHLPVKNHVTVLPGAYKLPRHSAHNLLVLPGWVLVSARPYRLDYAGVMELCLLVGVVQPILGTVYMM